MLFHPQESASNPQMYISRGVRVVPQTPMTPPPISHSLTTQSQSASSLACQA